MLAEAGKGSKQRPTNAVNYGTNFDNIFGRRYLGTPTIVCPWCGVVVHTPCNTTLEAKECNNFKEED